MDVVVASGRVRTRSGPKEPALRDVRVCYDHLAGGLAVGLLRALIDRRAIREEGEAPILTDDGAGRFERFDIDLLKLRRARRPVCRACLDRSGRRTWCNAPWRGLRPGMAPARSRDPRRSLLQQRHGAVPQGVSAGSRRQSQRIALTVP